MFLHPRKVLYNVNLNKQITSTRDLLTDQGDYQFSDFPRSHEHFFK